MDLMQIRRQMMGVIAQMASGGVKRKSIPFSVTSNSYYAHIPVDIDHSKILFLHFYDEDAVYTTAGTTYEGFRLGPALTYAEQNPNTWCIWRTNAAGTTTGYNNYGASNTFDAVGYINVSANPMIKANHSYILDVFYEE